MTGGIRMDQKKEIFFAVILLAISICLIYPSFRQKKEGKNVTGVLSEKVVQENEEKKKTAYLTFDDGPSDVTQTILDILKEKKIKATFFLIGNEITKERESLIQRMAEEGHTIGIHTYSHKKNEIYKCSESYIEDVQKTSDRIYEVTGVRPNVYRFPWGSANCYIDGICGDITKSLSKKGLTYYDWNVSAEDSVGTPTKKSILSNIEKDLKKYKEPVILMHDSSINKLTAETLPDIIQLLQKEGYDFDTVEKRSSPLQYKH